MRKQVLPATGSSDPRNDALHEMAEEQFQDMCRSFQTTLDAWRERWKDLDSRGEESMSAQTAVLREQLAIPLGTLTFRFLHGRDRVDEQMDEQGFDGPVIKGLESVHNVYKHHIRFRAADPVKSAELERQFNAGFGPSAAWCEDMLHVPGIGYFGDFSVEVEP